MKLTDKNKKTINTTTLYSDIKTLIVILLIKIKRKETNKQRQQQK
jgi:hypothetical protein